ncbi:MAG: helix-turn-helix domain-containing protein, partial [Cyclobacteriaceae bacterium]
KEAARLLDVSPRTISRMIDRGELKATSTRKVYTHSLPKDVQNKAREAPRPATYSEEDLRKFRMRISYARNTDELHKVLEEAIERCKGFPAALLPQVKAKIDKRIVLLPGTAARIIADTHSDALYDMYKDRLPDDYQSDMMARGYYHQDLEARLCRRVYNWLQDKGHAGLAIYCSAMADLKALVENGRADTLDLLSILEEAIPGSAYDFSDVKSFMDHGDLWYIRQQLPSWKSRVHARLR